jgi:hypothetical protein
MMPTMTEKEPHKHVIFLGAGASATSGYPVANQLRLRMTSREELLRQLRLAVHGKEEGEISGQLLDHLKAHQSTLDLFRYGGFSTVDEFCRLARRSRESGVQQLKRLMRFVLCLHNPEKRFHESDYYPFLQRLFVADTAELREDIAILSFNYDPYLEFLVGRALARRWHTHHGSSTEPPLSVRNAVQSGLTDLNADIANGSGFCILKLHGSVAWPTDSETDKRQSVLRHEDLFDSNTSDEHKLKQIVKMDAEGMDNVPVFFPWEVVGDGGKMVREDDRVWSNVWKRARAEVQAAKKISFVGLSAHHYLEFGFQYLFAEKEGHCEFVVANVANKEFLELFNGGEGLQPFTPAGRIYHMLRKCSKDKLQPSRSKADHRRGHTTGSPVTPRYSFEDFIAWEMQ